MKRKKLAIDILMLLTFLISFISGKHLSGSDTVAGWIIHIAFSVVFIVLVTIHLCINGRGWYDAGKVLFKGEKYKAVRGRYIVDWLLLIVWVITSISGFPAIGYKLGEDALLLSKALHSGFSTSGLILMIAHIFQHKKQIKAYLGKRSK